MIDMIPLAKDVNMPFDFNACGHALNIMACGPTGCGKTTSITEPKLLYTTEGSLMVPVHKRKVIDDYKPVFKERGYDVYVLDLVKPEESDVAYDPFDYINDESDIRSIAADIIEEESSTGSGRTATSDPYWDQAAQKVVEAEIALAWYNGQKRGGKPSFADAVALHRSLRVLSSQNGFKTNLDNLFDECERLYPGNIASESWKTVRGRPDKTSACILSTVNAKWTRFFDDKVLKAMKTKKHFQFRNLGKKKTILFVYLPTFSMSRRGFINLMYLDIIRDLFRAAQEEPEGTLPVHTDIVFDDFACFRIGKFEDYISIFRAANISTTILLQDESQLTNMYGSYAADTIKNNCPTYIYFSGGNDMLTARNVAERLNGPVRTVLEMPLGTVIVFRPGEKPLITERYPILNDPLYEEIMSGPKKKHKNKGREKV